MGRLPSPRPGQVLGLVGTNGIGKSTALKILAGKLKPNLGRFEVHPATPILLALFDRCHSCHMWLLGFLLCRHQWTSA